jgi:hypothetical protein
MQNLVSNRISAQMEIFVTKWLPGSFDKPVFRGLITLQYLWKYLLIVCLTFYEKLRDACQDLSSRSAYNLFQLESVYCPVRSNLIITESHCDRSMATSVAIESLLPRELARKVFLLPTGLSISSV